MNVDLANAMIQTECDRIKALLVGKNRLYGNAALQSLNIFSPLDADAAIRVRIDDKLKRLRDGIDDMEDQEFDIIGYLILLRVNRALVAREEVGYETDS